MIRIMAPTGQLGRIPEEKLAEALAAGARIMTSDDMRALRHQVFMEHELFKERHQPIEHRRKRKSLIRSRSR